jgi:hypothetical protein
VENEINGLGWLGEREYTNRKVSSRKMCVIFASVVPSYFYLPKDTYMFMENNAGYWVKHV